MLRVVSAEQALGIILDCADYPVGSESVKLSSCVGRVAAADILSREDIPAFSRSVVDGVAVFSADTFGSSEAVPAMLTCKDKILMGENAERTLNRGECFEIPTGGRLPEGADSAVMVEYTEDYGDEFRYIQKPCAPKENVICKGDDIKTGQLLIKKGSVIRACDTGALAAAGICKIHVLRPLTVGIISTGDELIPCCQTPVGSQIRDVNSTLLESCVSLAGCKAKVYPIVRDEAPLLENCVKMALSECDCVLISGGSSVGERDVVSEVLSRVGKVEFHGIAVKPGKPTLFARAGGKAVFGLPGHPLAAFFVFLLFVKPLLNKMLGVCERERTVYARIKTNIPSNHGREEIVPVVLDYSDDVPVASALSSKSGVISVLSKADGYLRIDRDSEGAAKDSVVKIHLL